MYAGSGYAKPAPFDVWCEMVPWRSSLILTEALLFLVFYSSCGDSPNAPECGPSPKSKVLFHARMELKAGSGPSSVLSTDLDGDGDNDLAVASGFEVSVLLNNGDGTFGPNVGYETVYGSCSVYSSDLDDDGDNDLAVDYGAGDSPVSVYSCDLDGDGDNDLAVANEDSGILSVLMNATGD